jgi:hypothetical protein
MRRKEKKHLRRDAKKNSRGGGKFISKSAPLKHQLLLPPSNAHNMIGATRKLEPPLLNIPTMLMRNILLFNRGNNNSRFINIQSTNLDPPTMKCTIRFTESMANHRHFNTSLHFLSSESGRLLATC